MAGPASQAGDADSSRTPGLASGLQGFMNVHRGALLLVPQWSASVLMCFTLILLQKSLHSQTIQKSNVTAQKRNQKLRLHNDCEPV